jgi:hypothetical protein
VDLGEEPLQFRLKSFFLCSLVELAEKVAARLERIERKGQGRHTQVLRALAHVLSNNQMPNHAPCVISEAVAARVHHPKIWVTKALLVEAGRLVPGF